MPKRKIERSERGRKVPKRRESAKCQHFATSKCGKRDLATVSEQQVLFSTMHSLQPSEAPLSEDHILLISFLTFFFCENL